MLQQADLRNSTVARGTRRGHRAVGAAVVDENDLEWLMRGERAVDFARERLDVLGLVADGNDDGELHGGRAL